VLIVTLVIGFLFWRTITRPMRDLVRYTEMVGSGVRDPLPLPGHHGTRELATLSRSFVDMATRLNERADYITTFAAHVSHELKSPLSAIRGAAELLRDSGAEMSPDEQRRFLDNILADADRLTALVARLRELARADNPRIGETRLDAVVAAVRAGHPALSVTASGVLEQPVRISAENAGIVLTHLADNASRHHARTLEIVARAQDDRIVITVRNDGDPIADNNREKVFTPFFTTRRESGGTGMGLEIVRSMLHAHGGGIRLVATEPVTFEIDIPRA
jgi:signal transduction histidine kinase